MTSDLLKKYLYEIELLFDDEFVCARVMQYVSTSRSRDDDVLLSFAFHKKLEHIFFKSLRDSNITTHTPFLEGAFSKNKVTF